VTAVATRPAPVPAGNADRPAHPEHTSARPAPRARHDREAAAPERTGSPAPARPETRPEPQHRDPSAWISHGLKPAAVQDENLAPAAAAPASGHASGASSGPGAGHGPDEAGEPAEWLILAGMDGSDEVSGALRRAGRTWPVSRHEARRMTGTLRIGYLDRALMRWR
jgi:hypothetical protein